jgi:hypothetical protein
MSVRSSASSALRTPAAPSIVGYLVAAVIACGTTSVFVAGCGSGDEPLGTDTEALLANGSTCSSDSQCAYGLCNTYYAKCELKGPYNYGCRRDVECAYGLCNTYYEKCEQGGAYNYGCLRDVECAYGLCNTYYEKCEEKGAHNYGCLRDVECLYSTCNVAIQRCN